MKIFFPVLNWGLGHASRSLPLIKAYQQQGHEMYCASDGEALSMLRKELPDLMVFQLPGYGIQYGSRFMPYNMLKHGPKMIRTMWTEHDLTKAIVKRHGIECIISDNRYGCYHPEVPSALITHQLQVFTGQKILDVYIRRQIRSWIKNFNEIWIPDQPPKDNITGELSDIDTKPIPKFYLGVISELSCAPSKGKYDAVAVISGPEPARTHFETLVIKQLSGMKGHYAVVQGKPDLEAEAKTEGNLTIFPYRRRAQLSELLAETEVVIARSGYTTLMDLAKTGHRAIFCPTPGQYEQIYLADRLANQGQCVYVRQENLDLTRALDEVNHVVPVGHGSVNIEEGYEERLHHLLGIPLEDHHQQIETRTA